MATEQPALTVAKSAVEQIADLITAVSSFAWPALILFLLYYFRDSLSELIRIGSRRLEHATDIEIGWLKFKGVKLNSLGVVIPDESHDTEQVSASIADFQGRDKQYEIQKRLMLVHTIRPAEPEKYIKGLRVFDVSVFLHSSHGIGRLNDVKSVAYYFGNNLGGGENGSKYVVKNSRNGFALTAPMYGSLLCMATIEFHDGTSVLLDRYLDVEMAPVYGVPLRKARG